MAQEEELEQLSIIQTLTCLLVPLLLLWVVVEQVILKLPVEVLAQHHQLALILQLLEVVAVDYTQQLV